MGFAKGDVVLLRRDGRQRHVERAALIWRVEADGVWFFLISGVRSLERAERHRSEIDISPDEAHALGLPLRFPVIYCERQHKLPAMNRLPLVKPIGRVSPQLLSTVDRAWTREVVARQVENRLSFRQQPVSSWSVA